MKRVGSLSSTKSVTDPISIGLCAMDKKVQGKPMRELVKRLESYIEFGDFVMVEFGDDVLLNKPIEEWPTCDTLIAFYSDGFPLQKAIEYSHMYPNMFLLNDLEVQNQMFDRRNVYQMLVNCGVPVPSHVFCNRDAGWPASNFEEFEDHIVCNGKKISKPFVEKPVDSEDHNVWIYYPRSAGGGTKRLFRKIGDKSSEFYPEENKVRRGGSFIYEEFMTTEGTDVKVYAVGDNYAHAEARKSPVVDGVVQRKEDGKEVRYPVMLSSKQKKMAKKIVVAFKQTVCGFDLLVSGKECLVCDVNGWSFVKNSQRFWDDTAKTLADLVLNHHRRHRPRGLPKSVRSLSEQSDQGGPLVGGDEERAAGGGESPVAREEGDELLCVIGIIRHGDRTPKQKMKMKLREGGPCSRLMGLFRAMRGNESITKELKLKAKKELMVVLETCRIEIKEVQKEIAQLKGNAEKAEYVQEAQEKLAKLQQMRTVLEKGSFSGINRKVQVKPLQWIVEDKPPADTPAEAEAEGAGPGGAGASGSMEGLEPDADGSFVIRKEDREAAAAAVKGGRWTEVLVVVKWGGNLTSLGKEQAAELGERFRNELYPNLDAGELLRLHNSFQHDLKIFSSDEGRVQMTAAAFTKAFLALEGDLTPILVSLVSKDKTAHNMLDPSGVNLGKEVQEDVKSTLREVLQKDEDISGTCHSMIAMSSAVLRALEAIRNPTRRLADLHAGIGKLLKEIEKHMAEARATQPQDSKGDVADLIECHDGETLRLLHSRWKKLHEDIYNKKSETFEISKIPDVYDCTKYDAVHNTRNLRFVHLDQLYRTAKALSEFVAPSEYGMTRLQRLDIGSKICRNLLDKIVRDMKGSIKESQRQQELASKRNEALSDSDAEGADQDQPALRLNKAYLEDEISDKQIKTRLYFTSESHIHSVLNVLRYCHYTDDALVPPGAHGNLECHDVHAEPNHNELLSHASQLAMNEIPEFDYLSQIVFKVYEDRAAALSDPGRYKLHIGISPGVAGNPFEEAGRGCQGLQWLAGDSEVTSETFIRKLRECSSRNISSLPDGPRHKHALDTAKVPANKMKAADSPLATLPEEDRDNVARLAQDPPAAKQ